MLGPRGLFVIAATCAAFLTTVTNAQQTEWEPGTNPWSRCCGMDRWPMERGMMGGIGGMTGSMPRHREAMMSGVPTPYEGLANPLPRTRETLERGATIYAENCASCHGPMGRGDGEAAADLSPPPADLAWLSRMPMVRWDPFMYWAVAEGGSPFGTAMPAFKDALSSHEIWSVIAYIQARLPQTANTAP